MLIAKIADVVFYAFSTTFTLAEVIITCLESK